jgi:uncharacterized protein YhbP (UPF0306 family)
MDEVRSLILAYLESHNTVTLGTCHENQPWSATVFYASNELTIYFFSDPKTRHAQNIAVNPRVAATIQEDYHDWRKIKGLQMEGEVFAINSMFEKAKAMTVYARKYPEVIKVFTSPQSGALYKAFLKVQFYSFAPETIYYIDNERSFGKREEYRVGN